MWQRFRLSHLTKRHFLLVAAAVVAMAASAANVNAATIVRDTWQDGNDSDPASPTYSEMGVDSDTDADIESVWYQGGVGSLDPVGVGGPLRGDLTAGGASSATWTTYFTPEATPITLTNAGDSMKLTMVYRLTDVGASNTSQNFRFAVMDSPGASRISANGSPGSAAYTGYAIFANMGTGTLGNSNPYQLRERVVASGDTLSTSGNWGANGTANAGLANGATNGNSGYVAGIDYTTTMTFTKTALGELQIDASTVGGTLNNGGTASLSVIDSTPSGFTYDMFQLRPSGATTTARLVEFSRFQVDFTAVPEPTTFGMLVLGSLAATFVRRRGR